jgi:aconitate hydratase
MEGTPLVIFAGQEYGTGSSRDWAAKGRACSASRPWCAVLRAHPSLEPLRMGVLPLQFPEGVNAQTSSLDGNETFDFLGLERRRSSR